MTNDEIEIVAAAISDETLCQAKRGNYDPRFEILALAGYEALREARGEGRCFDTTSLEIRQMAKAMADVVDLGVTDEDYARALIEVVDYHRENFFEYQEKS